MRMLGILLVMMPVLGQAQSCPPWSVADAYLRAEASETLYTPAIGTLFFRTIDLPLPGAPPPPDVTRIKAVFTGNAVADFKTPANHASGQYRRSLGGHITLEVACVGGTCGAPLPGDVIAFLRAVPDQVGYTLATGPCGGDRFDVTEANVEQLRQCVTGGACAPSVPN